MTYGSVVTEPRCRWSRMPALPGDAGGTGPARAVPALRRSRRGAASASSAAGAARDISTAHRFKDAAGEYYCEPCWLEACERVGMRPRYQCCECGGQFSDDRSTRQKTQYVCEACYESHNHATPTRRHQAGAVAVGACRRAEESPRERAGGPRLSAQPTTQATVAARRAERDEEAWRSCSDGYGLSGRPFLTVVGGRSCWAGSGLKESGCTGLPGEHVVATAGKGPRRAGNRPVHHIGSSFTV